MKRKYFKIFSIFITTISLLISMSSFSFAATTRAYGHKYTRGISRVSYWIDYNSGTGFYEYLIINAEHNWENPGWSSPVNMVAGSSNLGTMLDIYTKNSSYFPNTGLTYYGVTEHYDANARQVSPIAQDWTFARIHINDNTNHNRNATSVQGSIIHEMGHAFGLAHPTDDYDNQDSIMGQSGFRTVETVQRCDTDALIRLYQ